MVSFIQKLWLATANDNISRQHYVRSSQASPSSPAEDGDQWSKTDLRNRNDNLTCPSPTSSRTLHYYCYSEAHSEGLFYSLGRSISRHTEPTPQLSTGVAAKRAACRFSESPRAVLVDMRTNGVLTSAEAGKLPFLVCRMT